MKKFLLILTLSFALASAPVTKANIFTGLLYTGGTVAMGVLFNITNKKINESEKEEISKTKKVLLETGRAGSAVVGTVSAGMAVVEFWKSFKKATNKIINETIKITKEID